MGAGKAGDREGGSNITNAGSLEEASRDSPSALRHKGEGGSFGVVRGENYRIIPSAVTSFDRIISGPLSIRV